jgi:hypothetical protein
MARSTPWPRAICWWAAPAPPAAGSSAQINHLSAGRIPAGATVERAVAARVGQGDFVHLELKDADFTTANRDGRRPSTAAWAGAWPSPWTAA